MARLLALFLCESAQARLRSAAELDQRSGGFHTVTTPAGWAECHDIAGGVLQSVLIVDPFTSGESGLPELRRFRHEFRSVPVLAYFPFSSKRVNQLLRITPLPSAVLLLDQGDSPERIRRHVVECLAYPDLERVLLGLVHSHPRWVQDCVMMAIQRALHPTSPDDLADHLGVHRRTLERRLHAHGLPSPHVLLLYCRFLHVARLLQDHGRSVETVAHHLGFGSASALCNALQRRLCPRPSDLRLHGYDLLLQQLESQWLLGCRGA